MDGTLISNYSNDSSILYSLQIAQPLNNELITYENNVGKFMLAYITPNIQAGGDEMSTRVPKNGASNVVNKDNLGLTKIVKTNFIELEVPRNLFTVKEVQIKNHVTRSDGYLTSVTSEAKVIYNTFSSEDKFYVLNLGGNVNNPRIIGIMKEASK